MPVDKSLFYYGPLFHRLLDPPLAEGRQVAASLIADGSSVLDIACGTGVFAQTLRGQKGCRVVGIDLSLKMLEFARRSNPYPDVTFRHEDATDLSAFADLSFDCATILMLMHELTSAQQPAVLREALRVARNVVVVDWACPLPRNVFGTGARVVDATFGRDHYRNFRAFLAAGGLARVLGDSGLASTVEHRTLFNKRCREAVVLVRG